MLHILSLQQSLPSLVRCSHMVSLSLKHEVYRCVGESLVNGQSMDLNAVLGRPDPEPGMC